LRFSEEASVMLALVASAIAIRSIPEVLSYPYLIGNDTVLYAGIIQRLQTCTDILSYFRSPLLPVMLCPLGKMFGSVTVMKIYPPIGYGMLAAGLYMFARKSLGMDRHGGFVATLFLLLQFGMLRVSWDLHRNILALAFLLVLLSQIQYPPGGRRLLLIGGLAVLVILTHELTALLMVAILVILAIVALLRRERGLFCSIMPAIVVSISMLGYMAFLQPHLVSELFAMYVWQNMLVAVPVFFGLLFFPLFPFAVLGYRVNRVALAWIVVAATTSFSPILSPFAFAFWDRWMLMMVLPLGFLAAGGMLRVAGSAARLLQRSTGPCRPRNLMNRIGPVFLLMLCFAPSVYLASGFMAYSSDRPFWYFDNTTLWRGGSSGIPATMLSNTVSPQDAPDVIEVISQLNKVMGRNDVVLAHQEFYGWLLLYLDHEKNLTWFEHNPVQPAIALAKARGFEKVYLLWFVPGTGWHAPDPDFSIFKEVFRSGIIVAYIYEE